MNRDTDEYRRIRDESTRLLDEDELDAAEPLVHDALARAKKLFPKNDPEIADCMNNLAALHRYRGRFREALAVWRRVLAMHRAGGEPRRAAVADTLGHMANLLVFDCSDYERAKPIAESAVAALRDVDPRGEDYAIALTDLAKCRHEGGDYAGARELYDEAIPIFEALGEGARASVSRISRGTAWLRLGDADRAIADYEDALREQEGRLGHDSPELTDTLTCIYDVKTNFGCDAADGGDHARGKTLLDGALEAAERRGEPSALLTALVNASAAAGLCDDLPRAAALAQRAVELGRKLGAKDQLAAALYRRANAHVLAEEFAQAVPLLERAIEIQQRSKDWSRHVEYQRLLGVALDGTGDARRAARVLRAALVAAERRRTRGQAEAERIEGDLIAVYRDDGDDARALPLADKRAKRAAKAFGRESTEYADAIEQLAHVHDDLENGARARELYGEVIAIRERLAPRSEDLAIAFGNLALHHVAAREWAEADEAFMRSIDLLDAGRAEETIDEAKEALGDDLERCPRFAARAKLA